MGAWGEGMLGNDDALDVIDKYRDEDFVILPNLKVTAVMSRAIKYGNLGFLGAAYFLLTNGYKLGKKWTAQVAKVIEKELQSETLADWTSPAQRRKELKDLQKRLMTNSK